MFPVKEYNKHLQVGDLIWYQKDKKAEYGGEDIGYIKNIIKTDDINRYIIFWFKPQDDCLPETRETLKSIRDMHETYIFPDRKSTRLNSSH